MSNVVDLNFPEPVAQNETPPTASAPTVGLLSSAGSRQSGSFRLDAGIGNQVPTAVKTSGSFKFYGGIQGQVLAQ